MTNRNKASGTGFEYAVVKRFQKYGMYARRQPGSGAIPGVPNDVVVDNGLAAWLVECKTYTDHPSMRQMMEWLGKVQENAKKHKYVGGFLVYNQKRSRKPVVVIALDDFLAILQAGGNT